MLLIVKLLRGFAFAWFTVVGTIIVGSSIVIWYNDGFARVQEIFNPFNVANTLVTIIALSPGFGAYKLSDLMRRRSAQRIEQRSRRNEANELESLITAYVRVLDVLAKHEGMVVAVDETMLPAPKERIKKALLVAIYHTNEPEMLGALKTAYVRLCEFQRGVGSVPIQYNLPQLPDDADRQEVIRAAGKVAHQDTNVADWMTVVLREQDQLVGELRATGYWEETV